MAERRRERKSQLPKEFIERLKAVVAKRPRTVIEHILKHGYVTTEELRTIYGYNHPPRAARDVREQGIPLESYRVTGSDGRKITAYRFGDPAEIAAGKLAGRRVWAEKFKDALVQHYGSRCAVCLTKYEPRYLQIDHRVPYQLTGDRGGEPQPGEFMLLCGSCNRAKSWSCEHCRNWKSDQSVEICRTCYWASPDKYAHVALRLIRRLDVTWSGDEVQEYEHLVSLSRYARKRLPEFVKQKLREVLEGEPI